MAIKRAALAAIMGLLVTGPVFASDVPRPAPVPVVAAAPTQAIMGYGELAVGWTRLRADISGFTVDHLRTYDAGAYINIPLGRTFNLEFETRGSWVDWAGPYAASDGGTFLHLYWRDPQRFALGGFAGETALSLYGMQGNMWTGGAEAQAYLGNLTFYGQAAAFSSTTSAGWLYFNGYFLRGTARYFATANLRLQFDAQWGRLNNSDRTDMLSLVGTAEYRFAGTPFAAFASARYDKLTPVVNQPYDDRTFLFGMRGYFGSGSLLDNDRRGAPMNVLPFPPLYALNFG